MTGPLAGIRVFDITLAMVGPWAAMQLGAMGADVIHVEPPTPQGRRRVTQGGILHGSPPAINGLSAAYFPWNANKRGLTLDMKSPTDRANAYELLKTCDVFLMNMRPDVAGRLGVDYETVSQINERIVYCTITGWGETGPMAQLQGDDGKLNYFTGMSSTNGVEGSADGELYRHSTQLDGATGNAAVQAILMALLARRRTGKGQRIALSMLRATTAFQGARIGEYLARGTTPQRYGSASQVIAPDRAFLCADARYFAGAATSEDEWRAFCEAISTPALLEDPRFTTNSDRVAHRGELHAALEPIFRAYPLDYWVLQFRRHRLPHGWQMHWEELRNHSQVMANEYILDVPSQGPWGDVWTGGPPWRFSATPAHWSASPDIGEHNEEILREIEMHRRGAARTPAPARREP